MRIFLLTIFICVSTPLYAASGQFFSLKNTDFVVLCSFSLFIGILFYFKVPGLLGGMLDKRSDGIRKEIDEARALRDEAQSLLASYERKQKEAMEQAERILATARADAAAAADQAKTDLTESVARRMAAAEERISTAQASAEKEVRDAAIKVAIEAASEVISNQLTAPDANKLIDLGISEIENKLH
jgi:F-type H+-transporting ATPase subunit b